MYNIISIPLLGIEKSMNLVENRSAQRYKNSKTCTRKTFVSLCFVDILSAVHVLDTDISLLLHFMKFIMFMMFDIPNFLPLFNVFLFRKLKKFSDYIDAFQIT